MRRQSAPMAWWQFYCLARLAVPSRKFGPRSAIRSGFHDPRCFVAAPRENRSLCCRCRSVCLCVRDLTILLVLAQLAARLDSVVPLHVLCGNYTCCVRVKPGGVVCCVCCWRVGFVACSPFLGSNGSECRGIFSLKTRLWSPALPAKATAHLASTGDRQRAICS